MKSMHKNNFFDDITFNKITKSVLEKINDKFGLSYGKDCTRNYRMTFLPTDVEDILLEKAKQETEDNSLEILYNQIVKYQIKDEVVPKLKKHLDNDALGEWVMDIVLDCTVDWPIVIEEQAFSNNKNSVTFIRGEEEMHWRPNFPSENKEDYVLLLFVHLASKDSRTAEISREIRKMGEERADAFFRSWSPSWGSKYND